MTARLHYIYDPLCGWCYCAEPLAAAAAEIDGLSLVLHGGGLWPEPTRLPEATRRYIQRADRRIAEISGQPFGEAYLDGLLLDATMTLDSRPTIAAILAAETLDPRIGFSMLRGIQRAHYVNGRRVVTTAVLCDVAESRGLDRDGFQAMLERIDPGPHVAATRELMRRVLAQGFPTFVLERNGALEVVPHHDFLGRGEAFARLLVDSIADDDLATAQAATAEA